MLGTRVLEALGWSLRSGGFAKSRADRVGGSIQDWLQEAVARIDLHNWSSVNQVHCMTCLEEMTPCRLFPTEALQDSTGNQVEHPAVHLALIKVQQAVDTVLIPTDSFNTPI